MSGTPQPSARSIGRLQDQHSTADLCFQTTPTQSGLLKLSMIFSWNVATIIRGFNSNGTELRYVGKVRLGNTTSKEQSHCSLKLIYAQL